MYVFKINTAIPQHCLQNVFEYIDIRRTFIKTQKKLSKNDPLIMNILRKETFIYENDFRKIPFYSRVFCDA